MKTICLNCGHEQDRKHWAKTPQRCTVCRSRKLSEMNGGNDISIEKINNTTDNTRLGTTDDIIMPPLSNQTPPVPNQTLKTINKARNEERRKRWKMNELLHQQGRREQSGLIREVVEFIGSMVSEKNPRGHGSKAINHAFKIAEIKRKINDEGGDTRLLGENTRMLTGDDDSLFGFGFTKIGKGGILEHFRRSERFRRNE